MSEQMTIEEIECERLIQSDPPKGPMVPCGAKVRNGQCPLGHKQVTQTPAERLEVLRGAIRDENISMGELIELQGLAEHIDDSDVELLQAAGVPEPNVWDEEQGDWKRDPEVEEAAVVALSARLGAGEVSA